VGKFDMTGSSSGEATLASDGRRIDVFGRRHQTLSARDSHPFSGR
jgi:hypothetical protein